MITRQPYLRWIRYLTVASSIAFVLHISSTTWRDKDVRIDTSLNPSNSQEDVVVHQNSPEPHRQRQLEQKKKQRVVVLLGTGLLPHEIFKWINETDITAVDSDEGPLLGHEWYWPVVKVHGQVKPATIKISINATLAKEPGDDQENDGDEESGKRKRVIEKGKNSPAAVTLREYRQLLQKAWFKEGKSILISGATLPFPFLDPPADDVEVSKDTLELSNGEMDHGEAAIDILLQVMPWYDETKGHDHPEFFRNMDKVELVFGYQSPRINALVRAWKRTQAFRNRQTSFTDFLRMSSANDLPWRVQINPLGLVHRFFQRGFHNLHMVDVDGVARDGYRLSQAVVCEVMQASCRPLDGEEEDDLKWYIGATEEENTPKSFPDPLTTPGFLDVTDTQLARMNDILRDMDARYCDLQGPLLESLDIKGAATKDDDKSRSTFKGVLFHHATENVFSRCGRFDEHGSYAERSKLPAVVARIRVLAQSSLLSGPFSRVNPNRPWCPQAQCMNSPLCQPCKQRFLFLLSAQTPSSSPSPTVAFVRNYLNKLPHMNIAKGDNQEPQEEPSNRLAAIWKMTENIDSYVMFRSRGEQHGAWGHGFVSAGDVSCPVHNLVKAIMSFSAEKYDEQQQQQPMDNGSILGFQTTTFLQAGSWGMRQAVKFLRQRLPCSRVVVIMDRNSTIAPPNVYGEHFEEQMLVRIQRSYGYAQGFVFDAGAKSNVEPVTGLQNKFRKEKSDGTEQVHRTISKLNKLVEWLGYVNCSYPESSELDITVDSAEPPDACHYFK